MKLASALLLFSMSAQTQAAPILTALQRYQTDGTLVSQPVITQGPNGEKLTVAIEESSPDDRLTARNESGVKVADVAVYKSTRTERVSILSAHVNVKGELIAITELTQSGMSGGSRLYADNMKTGASVGLTQVSQYPSLVSRTRHDGIDLVAIEIDLGQGAGNEQPVLLRIIDESNGQVLRDIYSQSIIYGRFLTNAQGKLKLLVTGYGLFNLIDIESGEKTNPLLYRSEKAAISIIETKLGDLVQVVDAGITTLYEPQAFAEGRVKGVRTYASDEISFSPDGDQLIEASKTKIRIRDFKSNKQIGKTIDRSPEKPSGPLRFENNGSVQDLFISGNDKIAVIAQAEMPMSYMRGTILTYFDLETGKVLRTRRQKMYEVNAMVMQDETGRLVSIERCWYGEAVDTQLVDVRANKVIQILKNDHRQLFMQSSKGKVVYGHEAQDGRLCLAYLSALADETCINDPLVTKDTIYGIRASKGELTVPLDNNLGKQVYLVD